MKKLILIILVGIFSLVVPILAFAQNTEPSKPQEEMSIEERKANIISSIDAHIKDLQKEKTCVSAAKTDEELRKCRRRVRGERRDLKQEMKEQKKD